MKPLAISLLLVSNLALAESSPLQGQTIFLLEENELKKSEIMDQNPKPRTNTNKVKINSSSKKSNLPHYYLSRREPINQRTESLVVYPTDSLKETLRTLKPGSVLKALVDHSVIAFPDEKSPVVARTLSGLFSGSRLVGFSRLEKNSNRIFIDFEVISPQGKASSFKFKGSALSETGSNGFEGIHHSKETKYFAGDFISTFIAAYFDSQVPRYLGPFGGQVEDTSLTSATKKAMAASSMASAERFREKLRKVPEFSELKGPLDIQILVLETPTEI